MTDDLLDRPAVHALLADGTTVRIRPALPGDHEQLQGFYEEMPPENRRVAAAAVCEAAALRPAWVLATPDGATVLDARIRLLPRHPQDPYPRRLR
ncbi:MULTISPECIES: hypothetical protein [unclassified Streptomyces]|uniref:hypothetical protein n=1 Tax=unclassified Streptomyces TaxID=2593676 RepID=UPI0038018E5E